MTSRSSASWRAIAFCDPPTSRRWSAARSIAPTIALPRSFMPATSTGPAPSSTTTRPSGSAPMAYALADRGARLLIERDGIDFANVEWSRKNREAGRPFIEHQLEVMDFYVALQRAVAARNDVRLIHPDELVAVVSGSELHRAQSFRAPGQISPGHRPRYRRHSRFGVRLAVHRRLAPLLYGGDRSRHDACCTQRLSSDQL